MIRHRSMSWRIRLGAIVGNLTSLVTVVTPAATGVAWLFLDWRTAALILLVGWVLLVPLFTLLQSIVTPDPIERIVRSLETMVLPAIEDRVSPDHGTRRRSNTDPLETPHERYVTGEIDEVEFERRVEHLLRSDSDPSMKRLKEE